MKHEALYAVTAQVIPVLWIVMVFQLRFFGTKAEEKGTSDIEPDDAHRATGTVTLLVIVFIGIVMWWAEATAIGALLDESDTSFSRHLIQLAMFSGGFMVFYIPVFPWLEALLERTPAERARQTLWRKFRVGPYAKDKRGKSQEDRADGSC